MGTGKAQRAPGRHQPAFPKTQEEADSSRESRASDVPERQVRKEAEDEEDEDPPRTSWTTEEKSSGAEHQQRTSLLQCVFYFFN